MSESRLSLRVGEEHEVRLPGLAPAGYRWFHEVEGDQDAVEVRIGPSPGPPAPVPVGSSPNEIFAIRALRPGKVAIRFEQRRRWEADVPPRGTLVLLIGVEP